MEIYQLSFGSLVHDIGTVTSLPGDLGNTINVIFISYFIYQYHISNILLEK